MILCVNIGNTNIRYAVGTASDNNKSLVPTKEIRSPEDFIRLFDAGIWESIDGSVLSSVVPEKSEVIREAVITMTGKSPRLVSFPGNYTVDFSGYKGCLGQDRIVCCETAAKKYAPVIVVDFGTATTINAVDSDGVFLGGAILPGVRTGLTALAGSTALLPEVGNFSRVGLLGNSTESCLVSGAVVGTACAVGGYVERIKSELGGTPAVVVTGGNAPLVLPHCDFEAVYEADLLVEGLFGL